MIPRPGLICYRGPLHQRQAMTLMELLVVLVILAVVATIAVQSLQPRVESARFEQTRKTLDEIRTATGGDPRSRQADGSPLISGFVADVGRLPRATMPLQTRRQDSEISSTQLQASSSLSLRELWDEQSIVAQQFPFQFRPGPKTPVDCADIQIPCGWRGPYLRLPLGQTELVDPWSRPFELSVDDDQQIVQVGWIPVGEFEQPIAADLTKSHVTVSGTIEFGDSTSQNVQVLLLAPDPQHSLTELKAYEDLDPNPRAFLFEEIPVGLRAIRVVADGKVFTKYIEVPHGGLTLLFDTARNTGSSQ